METVREQATVSLAEAVEACAAGAAPICRKILASGSDAFPQLNTRTGGYGIERGYLPGRGFRWAGFLAGRLWLLHDLTGNLLFRDAAHALATRTDAALAGVRVDRGNIGFDVYCAICIGYEITGNAALRDAALRGARALEDLYCESAGVYWQNNWLDAFVSETPACLLPILWAHRRGAADIERLRAHVHKSLDGGMLRDDGSVQHRLFFDRAGAITALDTSQGYKPQSTWARAQAWMLHSLVSCVEAFDDDRIRDALARAARWYASRVPEDGVLYYDFDDPRIGTIPRDSCGTLIGAVALRRCADLGIEPQAFRDVADRSEAEILRNYVSPGGVVLHGSWGVGEGKSRWNTLFPLQDVMPYGNYWLLELLHRRLRPSSPVLRLRPA
jgi:unsaturated chondroitin disaccharide hydrolase